MQQLKNIGLVLGVAFSVFFVSFMVLAFTYPSVGPTGGNVALPITTLGGQIINGKLGIGSIDNNYGLNVTSGPARFRPISNGPYVLLGFNDYGVYSVGTRDYFFGNVGIGSIPNEYKLNVGGKIYLGEKIEENDVAEVASTKGYVNSKISEIRELVVQGFSPLAYGIHTQNECWGIGGEVVDVPESNNPICKISASSCPAGWNQFGYYSTAVSVSISNPQYSYCSSNYPCSCTTENKPWGNASYLGWQAYYPYYGVTNRPLLGFISCGGSEYGILSQYTQDVPACSIYYTKNTNSSCSSGAYTFGYSTRTEIGCY